MAEESPFIEEGTKEPVAEEKTEQVDIDALMGKLGEFDVKDPSQLEGKLRNANDFSKMQSERDQFANELSQLRYDIQEMRKPQPQPDPDGYTETGQPINLDTLETMVSNSVTKTLDARDQRVAQHQKLMNDTWLKISGHKKYHLVKDEFETALKDPATVMKLQSGQVDAFEFYTDMVLDKYEGVTKETVKAFKQMRGDTGEIKPPHVESSARSPVMTKDERTARDKKIDELRTKAKSNPLGLQNDHDQDDFLDAALGDMFKE